jgi:hypothetical protein
MKHKALIGLLIVVTLVVGGFSMAQANPSFFAPGVATGTASSSVSYLTPGTGTTTTAVYDAYASGVNTKADTAVLLTQLTGSSTAATLNVTLEYSQDTDCVVNPRGCDWYSSALNVTASTSPVFSMSTVQGYTLQATGNKPGGESGVFTRTMRAMYIPMPMRYVRAVYTVPLGSTNAAVYGQIVPAKQQP